MSRNPIQDIVRTNHTIKIVKHVDDDEVKTSAPKQIHKKEEETHKAKESVEISETKTVEKISRPVKHKRTRTPMNKKPMYIAILALAVVTGLYFLSIHFGRATVYVTPKVESFEFKDKAFTAERTNPNGLGFEVMIVSNTLKKDATFTDSKQVSTYAKGAVNIYNSFSKTPQKLLIKTRLADDENHIYFTDSAVTIPGYTMSGTKIVPGSVSVTVTAEKTGSLYNGDPRDFVLVGFKGTAKADKIYARSKGPLTGGASGLVYMPTAVEKGALSTAVSIDMRSKLEKDIIAQVPPNYILFPGSMQFRTDFNPDTISSPTSAAKVDASGSVSAIIFKEKDLEKAIIRQVNPSITTSQMDEVTVPELKNLTFKISDTTGLISKQTTIANFTLTGTGSLLWHPNSQNLISKLQGIKKADVQNVFATDPGISSARVMLMPPWQGTLPKNPIHIKIKQE